VKGANERPNERASGWLIGRRLSAAVETIGLPAALQLRNMFRRCNGSALSNAAAEEK
jgi:hypothetical protein